MFLIFFQISEIKFRNIATLIHAKRYYIKSSAIVFNAYLFIFLYVCRGFLRSIINCVKILLFISTRLTIIYKRNMPCTYLYIVFSILL